MKSIIIGCGRLGVGLAQTLQMRGHNITVIDRDPLAFEKLGAAFKGRTVVGVGFDRDVLIEAGIEKADALAAVTASDEANAVAARIAKQVFRVPKVAARLFDPRKAEIYRKLGLPTISPVTLGVNRMAEILSVQQLSTVSGIGAGGVDLVDVEATPLIEGRTVAELTIAAEAHVVAISRGGRAFLPVANTVIKNSDILHLAVVSTSSDRVKSMLGMR